MTESILENLISLAKSKGIQAEVYYQSSQDTPIEFENNRLKSLQTKATQGVALRVIVDGKIGFASSTDLTRLDELMAAAISTAEIGDPVEFSFPENLQITTPESDYTSPSTDKLVSIGENLISKVHQYNPDILVDVGFHVRSGRLKLANTNNVYTERNAKIVSASVGGNLVRGEDFLQAYSYDVVRDGEPDYQLMLAQLLEKYRRAEKNATINSGQFPVLFTPRAIASTIGSLFDTILSGQVVVQKASPLADKIDEKVFDSRLTIFEDPTIGVSACPFDDEGIPTTKKTLIDQGVVKQFYWDLRWAARANTQSTGNGFRGGISRPGLDLVNLCISPGQTPVEQLIADMKEGIIVDQVLGAGQSNQLAGEFSVNLDLGYKVENGEIVGRVKNTMVAGSIFEAAIAALGDRAEWVGGGAYVPYILFSNLGVAAKS
jgi:PmbA protein